MSAAGYLTNQLLIAMPAMGDPNFSQTVALICDHSSAGALGLILNKPLPMRMGEVFEQLEIQLGEAARDSPVLIERPVLRGGPVQTDRGFVVHRAGGKWDSTLKVSEALHVTTSRDILSAIAKGDGPQEAIIALGYAGWEGGQLEQEIRANAWLNAPVDLSIVFDLPFEARWQAAARVLGVELSRISTTSGNA
jgi:putative transcriptional regulator